MTFLAHDFPLSPALRTDDAAAAFNAIQALRRRGEDWFECARRIGGEESVKLAGGVQNVAAAISGVSRRRMNYLCRGSSGHGVPAVVDPDLLPPYEEARAKAQSETKRRMYAAKRAT